MFTLVSEQVPAETRDDEAVQLYVRSYLLIRTFVGLLGLALPAFLLVGEAFMQGGFRTRGSLSAYYHTSMRDVFVGVLCVSGVLLITYMAAKWWSKEFFVSSLAGFAILVVALVPTARPDLPDGATRCGPGADPVPDGCVALQQMFGETAVAAVHYTFAVAFILALAAICEAFARDEVAHDATKIRARTHRGCRNAIFAALGWIVVGGSLGIDVVGLTPLYVGELVTVVAFGLAWLIKGHDLAAAARQVRLPRLGMRHADREAAA